jgi:hypothetical protein
MTLIRQIYKKNENSPHFYNKFQHVAKILKDS